MRSMRTKLIFLTVCLLTAAVAAVALFSVFRIRRNQHIETEQLLLLLCETGERNLDHYFNSVQKSVGKVASFVEKDLDGLEKEKLELHIGRVEKYFEELAYKTSGVLTYYYRIDPEISDTVKGFWYTNLDGEGFTSHEVTDITAYDTQDTSKLVWFTVPKHTGESIWLPPYATDNLNVRVISYNVPIRWRGQFVGVVGIEIDCSTMAKQVDSIRLYSNGYAFLNDGDGNVFYHPRIDAAVLNGENAPEAPEGLVSESTFLKYTYEGTEKQAVWLPLCNGMRLTVSAPVSEIRGEWHTMIREIIAVAALALTAVCVIAVILIRRFTEKEKYPD